MFYLASVMAWLREKESRTSAFTLLRGSEVQCLTTAFLFVCIFKVQTSGSPEEVPFEKNPKTYVMYLAGVHYY